MESAIEPVLLGPTGIAFAAVLGALFGSFANVCIVRWPPTDEHPDGRSVVRPGSHCPSCAQPIRWYDNVPLVSYFVLRGRCRSCQATFSPRYLLVEGATAILFAAFYHLHMSILWPFDPFELKLYRFIIAAGFAFTLVVIAFIDLDHKLILNKITYPAIVIFYALGVVLPERTWWHGLVGAVVGYGIIRLVADGYYLLTRRHGLGYGDGKLLAVVGAILGWQAVVVSLFLGSMLGSVIGGTWLVVSRGRGGGQVQEGEEGEKDGAEVRLRHVEIPFGPFLAAAALAYAFLEPWLRLRFPLLYH